MTNFNCACPAIQRGKGSGFLSEGSSWLRVSSKGSGETARMCRLAWTFAARIGDKYQIRLMRPILLLNIAFSLWQHREMKENDLDFSEHKGQSLTPIVVMCLLKKKIQC